MRIDASRRECAKNKLHARPTAKKSVDCGILAMTFLTCILFDKDTKTRHFHQKLLRESLLQMLA